MSESGPLAPRALAHRVIRMTGRDPDEQHRAATPLELLFDLTFVVAFGVAAEQLAHLLAEGHVASGLTSFTLAMLGVCWAWANFSWFASAYDTDDWPFRVATMVQMVGVLIFTLGLPAVFGSIDQGHHVDSTVTVAGYVVMRVAMVFQWTPVQVRSYGTTLDREVVAIGCLWYGALGGQPVQVVLSRPVGAPDGYELALVTTDPAATPAAIIERYADRWSAETCFLDARHLVGVGQARTRTRPSVEHTLDLFSDALLSQLDPAA